MKIMIMCSNFLLLWSINLGPLIDLTCLKMQINYTYTHTRTQLNLVHKNGLKLNRKIMEKGKVGTD